MKKLIESGLFGGGLYLVHTPELVRRYNACLTALGLEHTKLTTFNIDATGWSPEVAEECGNVDYMSLGAVNRLAIILTPEQNGLPVHRPIHSFDRFAMEKIFRNLRTQIADITSRTGLWVSFAHELSRLSSPLDLFNVDWIDIKIEDVAGLISGATEQRELVSVPAHQLLDESIREKIIKSAVRFGDLRYRSIIIPEIKFTDVRSFYTGVFGGVYVLRDTGKVNQMLVLENQLDKPICSMREVPIFRIDDEALPKFLEKHNVVDVSLGWYKTNEGLAQLGRLKNYMLAYSFYEAGEVRQLQDLNSAQKVKWIAAHSEELGAVFFELEEFELALRRGVSVKALDPSSALRKHLFRPSKSVRGEEIIERIVWRLISRLSSFDIERLFVCNKPRFYDLYLKWPEAKQHWAIHELTSRGHPQPSAEAYASAGCK